MVSPAPDQLVSVVVSTYRRTEYLPQTIRSLLDQTYPHLEVLVVSDGDDPETRRCVEEFSDSRVRYLFCPHAGRPAIPRNTGLREAQGELLAFCDDDDLWRPNKLELQTPILLRENYDVCVTEYDYINQDGKLLDKQNAYTKYYGPITWRMFFRSMGFICNSSSLFTRDVYKAVGGQDEAPAFQVNEDYEYWMRVLSRFDGYFLNEKCVSYRVHEGSIQRASPARALRNRLELHRILRQNHAIPWQDRYFKHTKLLAHYVLDRFPALKNVVSSVRGR